jgi:hypothetical protein
VESSPEEMLLRYRAQSRGRGPPTISAVGSAEPAGTGEAGLVGEHDQLRPVTRPELHHRSADVCLGRGWAYDEPFGDLFVGEPLGHQSHDLTFPLREHIEAGTEPSCLARSANFATRRLVTPGDSRASPALITRTAWTSSAVQCDARVVVDERHFVREHIVEFAGNTRALLAGASPCLLRARTHELEGTLSPRAAICPCE